MTDRHPTTIAAWQARMGLTDRQAAAELGMSLSSYQRHKLGQQGGLTANTKRHLLLACAAIEAGIQPLAKQILKQDS